MNRYTTIKNIVDHVQNKSFDFIKYNVINPTNIDPDKFITIVMTTHDRQQQTKHTLKTLKKSTFGSRITVIIVDDSQHGFMDEAELGQFGFQITYITIENCKKIWINPCVNYNIGFQEVQTNKVIIQNAEVCHCGDIIQHIFDHLTDRNYLVYDVQISGTIEINKTLHQLETYSDIYAHLLKNNCIWYQHAVPIPSQPWSNRSLHFLTGITHNNLRKLGGFDYDFALGSCFDDNEFIYRIQHVLKLEICKICNEETHLLGIHQWHPQGELSYDKSYYAINQQLFTEKCK